MADKETSERRVYNLPTDLLERLRAYQTGQNISSEVEAVRRLLDTALQMRDTVEDILNTLRSRYQTERDFRVLAKDILVSHALVTSVSIDDRKLTFGLRNGKMGRMEDDGWTYIGSVEDGDDRWSSHEAPPRQLPKKASAGGGWDAPKGDLDDDIPF